MRSASRAVARRWVTETSVCRPCRPFRVATIPASVSASRADVASSSTSTAGRRTRARARAMRWRWPPERRAPPSPAGESIALREGRRRNRGSRPPAPPPRTSASLASGPPEPDVLADGRVEEEAVLEHRAHLPGQRGQGGLGHVVAVEADGAAASGRGSAGAGRGACSCRSRSGPRWPPSAGRAA